MINEDNPYCQAVSLGSASKAWAFHLNGLRGGVALRRDVGFALLDILVPEIGPVKIRTQALGRIRFPRLPIPPAPPK